MPINIWHKKCFNSPRVSETLQRSHRLHQGRENARDIQESIFYTTEENNMRKQSGFTLIELMIVIAILGILMAIAIPAYSDYTIRAKVSEGLQLASAAKLSVAEYSQSEGPFPGDNSTAGIAFSESISGNYVDNLVISTGVITITYSGPTEIRDSTVVLTPITRAGSIRWDCQGGDVLNRYRPSNCRN